MLMDTSRHLRHLRTTVEGFRQTCNDGINVLQFSMAMNILYANTLTFHMDSGLTGFGVMIESDWLGGSLPVYRNSHVRHAVMSRRYITWN